MLEALHLEQPAGGLVVQVAVRAQRAAERHELGHAVVLADVDVPEELAGARLEPLGHDLTAGP